MRWSGRGARLVDDPERVRALAELGVVFLLFEIGLELPVERLRRLWRPALAAGALQVALTLGAVAAIGGRGSALDRAPRSCSARWSRCRAPRS